MVYVDDTADKKQNRNCILLTSATFQHSTDKMGYLTCCKIKVTTKLDKLNYRSLIRNYISIKNEKYSLAPASQLRDSTAFPCMC